MHYFLKPCLSTNYAAPQSCYYIIGCSAQSLKSKNIIASLYREVFVTYVQYVTYCIINIISLFSWFIVQKNTELSLFLVQYLLKSFLNLPTFLSRLVSLFYHFRSPLHFSILPSFPLNIFNLSFSILAYFFLSNF